MGFSLTSNITSLTAQNNIRKNTKKLNQSLTRLSTGLRINTGRDDPVGLKKSEILRSQIRSAEYARTNIANANTTFGVAEGYLEQLTEISQSMRDVAVQAADNTIDAETRESLVTSLRGLLDEYNRIANDSTYAGTRLLDGTFANRVVQAGTDERDVIAISIGDARGGTIGRVAILTGAARTDATLMSLLDISGPSGIEINDVVIGTAAFTNDGVSNVEADESAIAYARAINLYSSETGVTAQVLENTRTTTNYTLTTGTGIALASNVNLVINGVTVKSDSTRYAQTDAGVANLVLLINSFSNETGVVATMDSVADDLTLTATDGRNIAIGTSSGSVNIFGLTGVTERAFVQRGTFKLISDEGFTVDGAAAEFASGAAVSVAVSNGTTLDDIAVDTASNAGTALTILDQVIEQLQSRRAELGVVSNRLDIAETELSSRIENMSAAESVIRDADIAAETANYTLLTILQQMGAAVLAQANSTPQIALTLLQNL